MPWPRKGKPWSGVFSLSNPREIHIPLKVINDLADYKLGMLQRLMIQTRKEVDNHIGIKI
jgi:hypothetical protein